MNNEKQTLLIVASRLLNYPDNNPEEEQDIYECIQEESLSSSLKNDLLAASGSILDIPFRERQALYVNTFDMVSKQCLYLTSHELGDGTKRGAAMIKLQKMINQAGFERETTSELVDYIPMLLEFLAATEKLNYQIERLYKRLGVAFYRVLESIEATNAYTPIIRILMKELFPNPTKEEIEKLEFEREEADLEELPYPIMYQ